MRKLILCTDGSAKLNSNNKYDSGSAYILFDTDLNIIGRESLLLKGKTNNYAEMYSIFNGLKYIYEKVDLNNISKLIVVSDSQLCIKSLTEWMDSWLVKSKDEVLKNSSGDNVANQELIKSTYIYALLLLQVTDVVFAHVNSHQSKSKIEKAYSAFCIKNKNASMSFEEFLQVFEANNLCDKMAKKELGI